MCCEDIRVGRKTTAVKIVGTSNTTPVLFCKADDRRIAIIISSQVTSGQWFGVDNTVAVGNGILLPPNLDPLTMTIAEYGDFVRGQIWVMNGTGAQAFSGVEILLMDDICKE